MLTFNQIFTVWMHSAVLAVQTEAMRLVSGPLLKVGSGTLVNSFFTRVLRDGHLGIVGNKAPHAYAWEFTGITEADFIKQRQAFIIAKRGAYGPRSQKGVMIRARNYNVTKSKRPVRFLRAALVNEMTGQRGRVKYIKLARDVGYAVVLRYSQMLSRRYGLDMDIRGFSGNAGMTPENRGVRSFAYNRTKPMPSIRRPSGGW